MSDFLRHQPRPLDAEVTYIVGSNAADVLEQAAALLRRQPGASFLSIAVTWLSEEEDPAWRGILVVE